MRLFLLTYRSGEKALTILTADLGSSADNHTVRSTRFGLTPASGPLGPSSHILLGVLDISRERKESLVPTAAAAAKSLQSCLTLCNPIDGSPPGSPIPGILQARTLE